MNVPWNFGHFRFIAVLPLVGAILGVAPSTAATASTCVSWTGTQPPNPSTADDSLQSVTVLSPCNVWAVGSELLGSSFQTLTEHWNGASWKPEPSSNPGGSSEDNILSGVAATSSSNAWAVGSYGNSSNVSQTLVELLSNGNWEQVASPNPVAATGGSALSGVATTSAKNAWAVGEYFTATSEPTLIEHWNGAAWSVVRSPNRGHTDLLIGVTATSAKNAWAVGYYFNSQDMEQSLIERWNGSTWKVVPSPDPAGSGALWAVGASSANNAWAVGDYFAKNGFAQVLIVHWNGTKWSRVLVPSMDRESVPAALQGLTVLSATDAWAVGSSGSIGSQTLIAHWDGTRWSKVPSPNLAAINHLTGVDATSPADIWAVGNYLTGNTKRNLALHCC
jgi:hypothetical protein